MWTEFSGYIVASVTWLITALAIFGNTWDATQKGFKRLTPLGRFVSVLALTGLVFGFFEEQKQSTLDAQLSRTVSNINMGLSTLSNQLVKDLSQIDAALDPGRLFAKVLPQSEVVRFSKESKVYTYNVRQPWVEISGFNCRITTRTSMGSPPSIALKVGETASFAFKKPGKLHVSGETNCTGRITQSGHFS